MTVTHTYGGSSCCGAEVEILRIHERRFKLCTECKEHCEIRILEEQKETTETTDWIAPLYSYGSTWKGD